jgi:hypothetical protein
MRGDGLGHKLNWDWQGLFSSVLVNELLIDGHRCRRPSVRFFYGPALPPRHKIFIQRRLRIYL